MAYAISNHMSGAHSQILFDRTNQEQVAKPLTRRDDAFTSTNQYSGETVGSSVNTFDPFRAVQERLREKMQSLTRGGQNAIHELHVTKRSFSPPPSPPPSTLPHQHDTALQLDDPQSPDSPHRPGQSLDTAAPSPTLKTDDYATYATSSGSSSPLTQVPAAKTLFNGNKKRSSSSPSQLTSQRRSTRPLLNANRPLPAQRNYPSRPSTQQQSTNRSKSNNSQRASLRSRSSSVPITRRSASRESKRVPTRVSTDALPKALWADATYLEHLTGAEVFALFRMRGLITTCGDSQESRLPQDRCHAMFLTKHEYEQLMVLRATLTHKALMQRQSAI